MTKQPKLDTNQLAIMAAIIGISNAGMDSVFVGRSPQETPETVKRYYDYECKRTYFNVESAVYNFGRSFFESEDMAQMFVDEAKAWVKTLKKMPIEKIKSTWPRYAPFVDAILEEEKV